MRTLFMVKVHYNKRWLKDGSVAFVVEILVSKMFLAAAKQVDGIIIRVQHD